MGGRVLASAAWARAGSYPARAPCLKVKSPKRTSFMQRGLGETIIGTHRSARPQAHTRSSRNSMIAACNSASSVRMYARGSMERRTPFSGK